MLSQISNSQKVLVMIGVMLGLLLAALDQTIVATAMPRIVQELKGLEHLSWVFTAYMLTSTITVPIYGKLSDIYGRKWFFLGAIIVFMLGSALSGLSQNMTQLILFRGFQGIGGGALFANAFTIIADLFPPAQRGKWQGIFGGVFGLASVIGPTLGGYLTDHVSWRWNFYINIPIGILALIVIYFLMPHIKHHIDPKERSIDYSGAVTLVLGLVPFLLALVWGGNQYAWNSIQEISLFILSVVFISAFIFIEGKAKEPILPLSLFRNNIFLISVIIIFLTGLGMFGTILYIPLFAQNVIGVSATNSGVILTPMTLALIVGSITSGQLISRTGRYKFMAIIGLGVVTAGIYLLSTMTAQTTETELVLRMITVGLGLGITMPIFTIAVQNSFEYSKLGVVTSSTQLFRSLGGTVGVAVMGSVLNNSLANKISDLSSDPFIQNLSRINPNFNVHNIDANKLQGLMSGPGKDQVQKAISSLPPYIQAQALQGLTDFTTKIKGALADSIGHVFFISTFLVALAFVLAFFLKEIPLRKSHSDRPFAEEAGIQYGEEQGEIPEKQEIEIFNAK